MQRAPPLLPLFPYTTLFRSRQGPLRDPGHNKIDRRSALYDAGTIGFGEEQRSLSLAVDRGTGPPPEIHHERRTSVTPRDRKSTRLNSSHLGISYAVFCLKKK